MIPVLSVLDSRDTWAEPLVAAARSRGWKASRIFEPRDVSNVGGVAFVRPHAHPEVLPLDRIRYKMLAARDLTMVQDPTQIRVYENKRAQVHLWQDWMPETWVPATFSSAYTLISDPRTTYPLVSKSDVGASSYNVWVLRDQVEAEAHIRQVFLNGGIQVKHCAGGHGVADARSIQKDYAILQRFIPHEVTYRVNVVGRERAIFLRRNYPDRPVAQTGNVTPVCGPLLSRELESLLEYAETFFAAAGTRWCAIDVLRDREAGQWKLIETSLSWPWPSPGECMAARFFPSGRRWADMWGVLLDGLEAGVWGELV